ncbi:hypothetical protein [Methanosphaera sp.]|jgi:hypothetical protein|uniref:hypothetical protein n=1 Tax=Methanosphaera sp. TaxID=2666342 RepID=UPI003D90BC69
MIKKTYNYNKTLDLLEIIFNDKYTHKKNISITDNITLEIDTENNPRIITIQNASQELKIKSTLLNDIQKIYYNINITETSIILTIRITTNDNNMYTIQKSVNNKDNLPICNKIVNLTMD